MAHRPETTEWNRRCNRFFELCETVGVDFEDAVTASKANGCGCIYFMSDAARRKFMDAAVDMPFKIELNDRFSFVLNVTGLPF